MGLEIAKAYMTVQADMRPALKGVKSAVPQINTAVADVQASLQETMKATGAFGSQAARTLGTTGEEFTALGRRAAGFGAGLATMLASNDTDLQQMMQTIMRIQSGFQMFEHASAAVRRYGSSVQALTAAKAALAAINVKVAATTRMISTAMLANPVTAVMVGLAAAVAGLAAAYAYFTRETRQSYDATKAMLRNQRLLNVEVDRSWAIWHAYTKSLEAARALVKNIMGDTKTLIEHERQLAALQQASIADLKQGGSARADAVKLAAEETAETEEKIRRTQDYIKHIEDQLKNEAMSAAHREAWQQKFNAETARLMDLEKQRMEQQQGLNRAKAVEESAVRRIEIHQREITAYKEKEAHAAGIGAIKAEDRLGTLERETTAQEGIVAALMASHGVETKAFQLAKEKLDVLRNQRDAVLERKAAEKETAREQLTQVQTGFGDWLGGMMGDLAKHFAAKQKDKNALSNYGETSIASFGSTIQSAMLLQADPTTRAVNEQTSELRKAIVEDLPSKLGRGIADAIRLGVGLGAGDG